MKPSRSVPISYLLPDWLRVPVLPILVATELRAIFPAWLFAVLAIAISPLLPEGPWQVIAWLGYGFGCAALGAIAAGHDFVHRTVGTVLCLPIPRERLWCTRLSVSLGGMILLAVLTGVTLQPIQPSQVSRHPTPEQIAAIVVFLTPVLSGVFVAPWLTLLCRNALAGTVFTVCLPFLFWMVGELLAGARFGFDYAPSSETQDFKAGATGLMLLAHWVTGAFFGWRKFVRLEAMEGRVGELHLPRWLSRQNLAKSVALSPKRGHPIWQLVKKELRLQQTAFITASLYLLACLCLWTVHQFRSNLDPAFIGIGTFLYVGLVSILIGAVASAEERQMGTAEWQVLLPLAARTQWAVKVATVLGLTVFLAALLPAYVLQWGSWGNEFKDGWVPHAKMFAGVATALAAMSLYFSSICNNGLKAMLISLPAGLGLLVLIGKALDIYESYGRHAFGMYDRFSHDDAHFWIWVRAWLPLLLLVGLLLLTLRFALVNHRSAERGASRTWRQVACLIAYIALSAAVCYAFAFLFATDDRPYQEEAQTPASSATPTTIAQLPSGMNAEMLKRYGLIPKNAVIRIVTNVPDFQKIQAP